jgi:hypothetical protein
MDYQTDLLKSVLQYHHSLVDKSFVDRLMGQIEKRARFRQRLLGACFLLGSLCAALGLSQLPWDSWLSMSQLGHYSSPLLTVASTILLLLFGIWVFNDEFELP